MHFISYTFDKKSPRTSCQSPLTREEQRGYCAVKYNYRFELKTIYQSYNQARNIWSICCCAMICMII